jgi:hypothetical protein
MQCVCVCGLWSVYACGLVRFLASVLSVTVCCCNEATKHPHDNVSWPHTLLAGISEGKYSTKAKQFLADRAHAMVYAGNAWRQPGARPAAADEADQPTRTMW